MKRWFRRYNLSAGSAGYGAAIALVLALLLLASGVTPAARAQPQPPHQFYGSVYIGGSLAAAGTKVEARVNGVKQAETTVDSQHRYGYSPLFKVPGSTGTVTFYIGTTTKAVQEVAWQSGGINRNDGQPLHLSDTAIDLTITTTSLPAGQVGTYYSQTLQASGGATPYTWSYTGSLPTGLSLSAGGVISGTPTVAETSTFTVQVTDAVMATDTQSLSITIGTELTPPAELTLDRQVGASADDAVIYQAPLGTWNFSLNGAYGVMGCNVDAVGDTADELGMRFTGVTIPAGAIITTAYLTFRCNFTTQADQTPVYLRVKGEQNNNAAAFSTLADYQGRAKITAKVDWDNVGVWTLNVDYNSPEIKTIIQELVDDYGGLSSANIVLFCGDSDHRTTGNYCRRVAYTYDSSTTYAPKLHIEYSGEAPKPPEAPTLLTPSINSVTFSWNAVSGATKYHLQVSTSDGFGTTVVDDNNISGTSKTVTGSFNQGTYYWRVKAYTTEWSGWSSTGSIVCQ